MLLEWANECLDRNRIDLINIQVLVKHIYGNNISFFERERFLTPNGYTLI